MIDWALFYISIGFPVFPVGGGKDGKSPYVKWTPYQSRVPTEDEVRRMWGRFPDAGIGLATGETSGVVVLDADSAEAVERMEHVLKQAGVDEAVRVRTSRGAHYYFRHPGFRVKNGKKVTRDTDVRGDGGYVVLPPSEHLSGHIYEWDGEPWGINVPDLPPVYLEKLRCLSDDDGTDWSMTPAAPRNGVGVGSVDRVASYCSRALDHECDELSRMPKDSGRNNKLARAAFAVGGLIHLGTLTIGEVERALYQASRSCGLVREDGAKSVWKTLKGQLAAGMAKPRQMPESDNRARSISSRDLPSASEKPGTDTNLPARELIRNYLLSDEEGLGLGLAWREGAKAWSTIQGRLITRTEIKESFPEPMMECLLAWSEEIANDTKDKVTPQRLWGHHAPAAFFEVLGLLGEAPEDELDARLGLRMLVTSIKEALTLPVHVQKEGIEAAYLSTLVREAERAHNVHWDRIGHLDAWARRGDQLALRISTLKTINKKLMGIPDKALARQIVEAGLGESARIRINNRHVRVFVMDIGMSTDSLIAELESDPPDGDDQPPHGQTASVPYGGDFEKTKDGKNDDDGSDSP